MSFTWTATYLSAHTQSVRVSVEEEWVHSREKEYHTHSTGPMELFTKTCNWSHSMTFKTNTVAPSLSGYPRCKAKVVTPGRWSPTRGYTTGNLNLELCEPVVYRRGICSMDWKNEVWKIFIISPYLGIKHAGREAILNQAEWHLILACLLLKVCEHFLCLFANILSKFWNRLHNTFWQQKTKI